MPRYARFYSVARPSGITRPTERPAAAATVDYDALLKTQLVDLASQRGLDTTGTKAELAARLRG